MKLKTLKELKWYECGTGGCGDDECCGSYGEMEEVEKRNDFELFLDIIELRLEAINWVKESLELSHGALEIEEIKGKDLTFFHTVRDKTDRSYDFLLEGKISVLIQFFNLTEKDLEKDKQTIKASGTGGGNAGSDGGGGTPVGPHSNVIFKTKDLEEKE